MTRVLLVALTTLVVFAQSLNARKNPRKQGCFPVEPTPYPWDVEMNLGVWYSYGWGPNEVTEDLPVQTNVMTVYTGLGYLRSSELFAVAWEHQFRVPGADSCTFYYNQQNISSRGDKDHTFWLGEFSRPGRKQYLYIDPKLIQVEFRRLTPSEDGYSCERGNVQVYTRKPPSELTQAHTVAINSVLDTTLIPYCMDRSDVTLYLFYPSIPLCTFTDRPHGYLDALSAVERETVSRCFK